MRNKYYNKFSHFPKRELFRDTKFLLLAFYQRQNYNIFYELSGDGFCSAYWTWCYFSDKQENLYYYFPILHFIVRDRTTLQMFNDCRHFLNGEPKINFHI